MAMATVGTISHAAWTMLALGSTSAKAIATPLQYDRTHLRTG
jgi:hypothetical protein